MPERRQYCYVSNTCSRYDTKALTTRLPTMIFSASTLIAFLTLGDVSNAEQTLQTKRAVVRSFADYANRRSRQPQSDVIAASTDETVLQSYADDGGSSHLRSLKAPNSRDNFLRITTYTDSTCNQVADSISMLVNYCFEWGKYGVLLNKVNNKEKTIVQLSYDGDECGVVPGSVRDIVKGLDYDSSMEFGQCFYNSGDDTWKSVDYLSERYDITGGVSYSWFATEDMCHKNKFRNVYWEASNVCLADGNGGSYMNLCQGDGGYNTRYWDSVADCSGAFDSEVNTEVMECLYDDSDFDEYYYYGCRM